MKFLLDTHAFIWFIAGDNTLSNKVRELIEDTSNERLISSASAWEMAIKFSLGKLMMDASFDELFPDQLQSNDITLLPIHLTHLSRIAQMPLHHRDPFDRLLVAQCQVEGIPILSRDPAFDAYGIQRIW